MESSRKRVNKYGKGARRVVVHDLFDIGTKHTSLYAPVQSTNASSLVSSRERTPFSDVSEDQNVSRQLNSELLNEVDFNRPRLKSPARKLQTVKRAPQATSTFDIESSDEDVPKSKPVFKTYKRRKVTPDSSDREDKTERGRTAALKTVSNHGKSIVRGAAATVRAKSSTREPKKTSDIDRSHSLKPRPRPTSRSRALSPPLRFTPEPRTPPGDIGSPASDVSMSSMVTTRSATKRKREANDGALSDVSSPSQLELSSLRLTPQRNVRPRSKSGVREGSEQPVPTSSRVRRRLIDSLDAAKPNVDEDLPIRDAATPKKHSGLKKKDDRSPMKPSLSQSSSQLSDSGQQQTVRPRKYGKQRSHLRDMVSEAEGQSQDSSQKSIDQLMSQVSALSETQPSQFDFEMSDDEVDSGVQLKSIHELRQAGAVNRYDRDLESLLEDVSTSTKAVRIGGLMQLVRKLKEQAFKRHLLDNGKVTKLTENANSDLDVLSASVMLVAFWTLAHSDSATSHVLAQLYQAILRLPARLLTENRPLSVIAKSRQENLSKALSRELADFESHVLDQSSSQGHSTAHIITSRIAIRCIETLQRKLVGSGLPPVVISRLWVQGAIAAVAQHLRGLRDIQDRSDAEHAESIRLLLAWLELAEGSSGGIGKKMTPLQLSEFGALLGDLLRWSTNENTTVEHSCLRLTIAVSNESNSTSEALASAGMADSVYELIEQKYPALAKQTSQGDEDLDEDLAAATSTSVILGLACLLDFADSSEAVRLDMMDIANAKGRSWARVDKLVDLFKSFVQETDEAIDESKAPILLPFGYLSLLLCTLSLNDDIRQHVTATIGRRFDEVIDRAAIFLKMMRSVSLDEASATAFVDRFTLTLESVKAK